MTACTCVKMHEMWEKGNDQKNITFSWISTDFDGFRRISTDFDARVCVWLQDACVQAGKSWVHRCTCVLPTRPNCDGLTDQSGNELIGVAVNAHQRKSAGHFAGRLRNAQRFM